MDWPDQVEVARHWPVLAGATATTVGSGLRFTSADGRWHLKRRPLDRVLLEVRVTDALAGMGEPVTVFGPTASGERWVSTGGEAFLLYPELPGRPVPQPRGEQGAADLRRLGAAGARLHRALAAVDLSEVAVGAALGPEPTPGPLASVFARVGRTEGLPTQLLHRDFHVGNVLFVDGQVSGFLDFDHLAVGPRPLDLAYAAGSVLARRLERDQPEIDDWLVQFAALVAGYQSVSPLTNAEVDRLPALTIEAQADFHAFFVAIGDEPNRLLTERMIELLADVQPRIRAAVCRTSTLSTPLSDRSVDGNH